MFQVIELTEGCNGSPICESDGKPRIFADGPSAAEYAKAWSDCYKPRKAQPRPVREDGAWQERERARMADGTYRPLPDWLTAALSGEDGQPRCPEHFPHVSTESPERIAYTESPVKGVADRQNSARVGRYLEAHYSAHLSPGEIRDLATRYAAEVCGVAPDALQFATTANEIERVYTTGPDSCMSHSAGNYASPFHPVRVYAAGDLAVAYLTREGRITARVVCWPAKKLYSRIYGDRSRLESELARAGYESGDLEGAKLTKHYYKDTFVVPYVDHIGHAREAGKFLILDSDGEVDCESTCGLSEDTRQACEGCGDRYDEDSLSYYECLGGSYCESCAESRVVQCNATGEDCRRDDVVTLADGTVWSQSYAEDHAAQCDATGDWYALDDLVSMSGSADGESWNREHAESHGFQCAETRDWYPNCDKVTLADGREVGPEGAELQPEPEEATAPNAERMPVRYRRPLTHADRVALVQEGQGTFRNWIAAEYNRIYVASGTHYTAEMRALSDAHARFPAF